MRITLYGFMGAGKTTLGKALAQQLDYRFVDLDAEIVKETGKSIPDIFAQDGEIAFRKIEHQVLKEFIKRNEDNVVLALGGGAILQPNNRKLLELRGFLKVYLDVSVPELINRLKNDKEYRPLLKDIPDADFDGFIAALHDSRKDVYERHADLKLSIANENFETVLNKLYMLLNLN